MVPLPLSSIWEGQTVLFFCCANFGGEPRARRSSRWSGSRGRGGEARARRDSGRTQHKDPAEDGAGLSANPWIQFPPSHGEAGISQPVLLPGGCRWRGLVPLRGQRAAGARRGAPGRQAQERTIWRACGEPSGSESRAKWWRWGWGEWEPLGLTLSPAESPGKPW